MLETGKYQPVLVVTEVVRLAELRSLLRIRTFEDPRVKTYHVPNLTLAPIKSVVRLGRVAKVMFVLFNAMLQLAYLSVLTLFLLHIVLATRPKLIHAHNPPDLTGLSAYVVSKITGVPYVFEVHDRAPELECADMGLSPRSALYRLLKFVERTVVTGCAALITVNVLTSKYFRKSGVKRTVAIYTGAGRQFQPCEADIDSLRAKYHLNQRRVILYAGSLNIGQPGASSGYDLELPLKALPKILEEIPNATLVFVGDGNGKQLLMRLSKSNGVHRDVIFTGFMSRKEVFTWISAADVVLVPYADAPNNRLTLPTKLWEYMAIGRPIVATRLPGICEVIEDGQNGLLYRAGSVDDLTQCILRILTNRQLAMHLISNAKQDFVARYSFQSNWPKLIALYDNIRSSRGTVRLKGRPLR